VQPAGKLAAACLAGRGVEQVVPAEPRTTPTPASILHRASRPVQDGCRRLLAPPLTKGLRPRVRGALMWSRPRATGRSWARGWPGPRRSSPSTPTVLRTICAPRSPAQVAVIRYRDRRQDEQRAGANPLRRALRARRGLHSGSRIRWSLHRRGAEAQVTILGGSRTTWKRAATGYAGMFVVVDDVWSLPLRRPGWRSSTDLLRAETGTRIDLGAMPPEGVARCRAAWARLTGRETCVMHRDPNNLGNVWMTAARVELIDWDESHLDVPGAPGRPCH
jgi:hypothetical protein